MSGPPRVYSDRGSPRVSENPGPLKGSVCEGPGRTSPTRARNVHKAPLHVIARLDFALELHADVVRRLERRRGVHDHLQLDEKTRTEMVRSDDVTGHARVEVLGGAAEVCQL